MVKFYFQKLLCLLLLVAISYAVSAQTPPTVATAPYFCGFEDAAENANWVLNPGSPAIINNPNFVNKWAIGQASHKQGYNGLYICKDNDVSLSVYAEKSGYTYAYREFNLPVGEYDLAFSWRCLGEFNADEVIAYWMPVSVTTNGGLVATEPAAVRPYKIALTTGAKGDSLHSSSAWRYAKGTVKVTNANQNYKLAFLWRNNNDRTYNPGGCIDNVQLAKKALSTDCNQMPANLNVTMDNIAGTMNISWSGTRGDTYDILYWLDGSGVVDSITGLTNTSYTIQTRDMNTGLYTVWVRSVCPDGTASLFSEVSGVKIVGKINTLTSACPEVAIPYTSFSEDGMKVLKMNCSDGGNYFLKANAVCVGGSIAGYMVEEIPYAPPFPFNAGVPFKVDGGWKDDIWSQIVELPFSFCFFDGVYNQAQVGANGIVTFDATHTAGSFCNWRLYEEQDIPNPNFIYKNSIFGVYEDAHMGRISGDGGMYFGVLGEYPCRTFTASWYDAPSYACLSYKNTYQIVMYEGTNVIDVYVKQRLRCDDWNNGIGIIGLINSDGTDGVAAPGRNKSDQWEVTEANSEAWRFIPLSTPSYEITWYKGVGCDGPVIGKSDSIWITPTDRTQDTVTVRMQFSACNGEYFDIKDTAIIQYPVIDSLDVLEVNICPGEVYQDKYIKTDEEGYHEVVLKDATGCDSLVYRLNLKVHEAIQETFDTTVCYGDTLHWRTATYTKTGTYTYSERYHTGCDSIIQTIHLTVLPKINYSFTVTDAMKGPNSGAINLSVQDQTYYYTLNGVKNAPLNNLTAGVYELIVYNQQGCAAASEEVTITTECFEGELILPIEMICADEASFVVPFSKQSGYSPAYTLTFSKEAQQAGFQDIIMNEELNFNDADEAEVVVNIPAKVRPGYYSATLNMQDLNCEDKHYPFEFAVFYSSSIVAQKWDDVLGVLNTSGYKFSAYQWVKNDKPITGANASYYYLGEDTVFQTGDMYQVLLTRVGESQAVPTCPFYPDVNRTASATPSLKQSVTAWTVDAPNIENATVTVFNAMGIPIMQYPMTNGSVSFPKPSQSGLYLIDIQPTSDVPRTTLRVMAGR